MSTDSLLIPKIRWVFPWKSGVSNKSKRATMTPQCVSGAIELSKRWHHLHFLVRSEEIKNTGQPTRTRWFVVTRFLLWENPRISDPRLGASQSSNHFVDDILQLTQWDNPQKNHQVQGCQKVVKKTASIDFLQRCDFCALFCALYGQMVVGGLENASVKNHKKSTYKSHPSKPPKKSDSFPASETLQKNTYVSNLTKPSNTPPTKQKKQTQRGWKKMSWGNSPTIFFNTKLLTAPPPRHG